MEGQNSAAAPRVPSIPKRITTGQRVSGCVGEKVANPDPRQKRKVRERVYGNVLEEAGPKKYRVQFDDGVQRDVSSKILRIERATAFLPAGETRAPRASTATASTSTATGTSDPASSFPLQEEDQVEDLDEASVDSLQEIFRDLGELDIPENAELEADDEDETEMRQTEHLNDLPINYHERLSLARGRIAALAGHVETCTSQGLTIHWKVIPEHHAPDLPERRNIGIKNIEIQRLDPQTKFADVFLHLMFADWTEKLCKMNCAISAFNETVPKKMGKGLQQ